MTKNVSKKYKFWTTNDKKYNLLFGLMIVLFWFLASDFICDIENFTKHDDEVK